VVSGDRNGVPLWNLLGTVGKNVSDQSHGRARREHVGSSSDVFLQNVVLDGAPEARRRCTLLFSCDDVHGQKYHGRGVDGHGGADFIERNAVEQHLHVFNTADRHANFSDFPERELIVGVHAKLGWQIKGHGKSHLTTLKEEFEPFVGLLCAGKTGILAHGPIPTAVHVRMNPSRVRWSAGWRTRPVGILGCIRRREINAAEGGPPVFAFLDHVPTERMAVYEHSVDVQ